MPRLPWELDVFTSINAGYDVLSLCIGIFLIVTRTRQSLLATKKPSPPTNSQPLLHTPSLWTRKRLSLVLFATTVTVIWHLIRLLLVGILSYSAARHAHSEESQPAYMDDMDAEQIAGDGRVSTLMEPPAVWGVMLLPFLMLFSRGAIILLFAFPKKQALSSTAATTTEVVPESPKDIVPSSPRHGKHAKPTSPTVPQQTTFVPTPPPSPTWEFIRSLPGLLYGPNQNLYMLAFYMCIATAIIIVPFTYHIVWYLDTPRLEPVASLYLAGVLKDATRVKNLTSKEKV